MIFEEHLFNVIKNNGPPDEFFFSKISQVTSHQPFRPNWFFNLKRARKTSRTLLKKLWESRQYLFYQRKVADLEFSDRKMHKLTVSLPLLQRSSSLYIILFKSLCVVPSLKMRCLFETYLSKKLGEYFFVLGQETYSVSLSKYVGTLPFLPLL